MGFRLLPSDSALPTQPASDTASDSVSGRRKQMTMQSDKGGGLSTNLAVQLGILAIVVTVLLHGHRHSVVSMIASQYFW
jgi:hypothetical protein